MSGHGRYIITEGYWGHIFDEKQGEVMTEWVYDTQEEQLIGALVASDRSPKLASWQEATADELADLEDSIKNANSDALEKPEDWGLTYTDELPDYAPSSTVSPAMHFSGQKPF